MMAARKAPAQKHNNTPILAPKQNSGLDFKSGKLAPFMLAAIVFVTALVFFPTLQNTFNNWDDNDYVIENQYIRSLSAANLEQVFKQPIALNYHPLTIITLALNYQVSGLEPFSYFLVNILLHLANVVLTFYFAFLILGRNSIMALFVAAIFAIHPMHVESVAWISERKDVLYGFFFISGMIAWIYYSQKSKWTWYLASFCLFVLAALSKPSSVVFPMMLFLIDFLFSRKFSLKLLAEKVPFLIVAVGIGLATLNAQVGISVVDIKQYNAVQQFLFAAYGFLIYLVKLFVPYGLSALHPVPVFNTSLDLPWLYFISPVLDIMIILLVLYSLKYTKVLFFALLFYLFNILLTLQFFQVGSAVIAERYTYMAYTGVLIGLAWLIERACVRYGLKRHLVYMVMVVFFLFMAVLAYERTKVWQNSGTLWTDVIKKYPDSYTAYNNRGYYYVNEGQYDKALSDFTTALELMPGFVDALNNRGSLYRLQEQQRNAIGDYSKALQIEPDHVKALSGRGNAYAALGVLDSALTDFNRAYTLNPDLATALGDRGAVFFRLGRYEEAIQDCSRKISIDPGNTSAYLNRGVSYSSLKKWDLAIPDYTFVLKSRKDNPAIYEWRGVALRNTGLYEAAIQDFNEAIRRAPSKTSVYINRARAYKLAGLDEQARSDIETARKMGVSVSEKSLLSDVD